MDGFICIVIILLVFVIYTVAIGEMANKQVDHYGGADIGNGLLRADTVEESASFGSTSKRNAKRTVSDCESADRKNTGILGYSGDSAGAMSRYMVRD